MVNIVLSNIYKTSSHTLIICENISFSDQNKSMLYFKETFEYAN